MIPPADIVPRVWHHISIHSQAEYRFSYTNPPLAQIPDDLEDIYIPDPGWPWITWDWDQAEPRFSATLSQDEVLQQEIDEGLDRNTIITCYVFELPKPPTFKNPSESSECAEWRQEVGWRGKKDKRRRAGKALGLALDYGKDPKLAWHMPSFKSLGIKKHVVIRGAQRYLLRYPKKMAWREKIAAYAMKHREIRDWMGGVWRLLANNPGKLRRQAYNGPHQVGVSRLHNETFVEIWRTFPQGTVIFKYGAHDAQKWAVPANKLEEYLPEFKRIVQQPRMIGGRPVPFPANFKVVQAKEDR